MNDVDAFAIGFLILFVIVCLLNRYTGGEK